LEITELITADCGSGSGQRWFSVAWGGVQTEQLG